MRIKKKRILATLITLCSLGLLILIAFTGCDGFSGGSENSAKQTQLKETELEINVLQTLRAQGGDDQSTSIAQQATQDGQTSAQQPTDTPQPPPTADQAATQTAEKATRSAQETKKAVEELAKTPQSLSPEELMEKMKTANILLYEDMIGNLDTNRFVKDTLDGMGLSYKDDGSAEGWLKSDLTSGAPNGEPWDLVILANEAKSNVSGEFFEYVNDALDSGASVILEVWYLDKSYSGTASTLLDRCGIDFQANWLKIPPARMVLFPLDFSHPILQQPNSGLSFTDVTSYWWDDSGQVAYDVGDLVKLTGGGDAQLILGTQATEKNSHGTVTVCLDGQLIIQTFSSHNLTFNAMQPLWENYIYNALKVRFEGQ